MPKPPSRLRYDAKWSQQVTLQDGQKASLRLIRPSDKEALREGMKRLSSESRFRRFLESRKELSDKELAYLTELDEQQHLAIVAYRTHEPEEGMAVARFIRLEDPEVAEAAVVVVDAYQHLGLGGALTKALVRAALERGIKRFRVSVLEDNVAILQLIESFSSDPIMKAEGGLLSIDCPLESPERTTLQPHLYMLLRLLGKGSLNAISNFPFRFTLLSFDSQKSKEHRLPHIIVSEDDVPGP